MFAKQVFRPVQFKCAETRLTLPMIFSVGGAFEARHPGHFAVVLVDNSRGHLTYAKNALRVGDMNFNSGGSQPCMRARWYKCADGLRVSQQMVFPEDYETTDLRGKPKGMKQVLAERGLYRKKLAHEMQW